MGEEKRATRAKKGGGRGEGQRRNMGWRKYTQSEGDDEKAERVEEAGNKEERREQKSAERSDGAGGEVMADRAHRRGPLTALKDALNARTV